MPATNVAFGNHGIEPRSLHWLDTNQSRRLSSFLKYASAQSPFASEGVPRIPADRSTAHNPKWFREPTEPEETNNNNNNKPAVSLVTARGATEARGRLKVAGPSAQLEAAVHQHIEVYKVCNKLSSMGLSDAAGEGSSRLKTRSGHPTLIQSQFSSALHPGRDICRNPLDTAVQPSVIADTDSEMMQSSPSVKVEPMDLDQPQTRRIISPSAATVAARPTGGARSSPYHAVTRLLSLPDPNLEPRPSSGAASSTAESQTGPIRSQRQTGRRLATADGAAVMITGIPSGYTAKQICSILVADVPSLKLLNFKLLEDPRSSRQPHITTERFYVRFPDTHQAVSAIKRWNGRLMCCHQTHSILRAEPYRVLSPRLFKRSCN